MSTTNEPLETVVSHYRVLRLLGAGGMGEVYEGFDETLKRRVAMKAIRPRKRLDPEAKARFLREARLLSQLDHPNICRVYDYLETDQRDWLVLELIEGKTLRETIQEGHGAIDPLAVARQIASVLAVMHAAGVVHRDLKPGNVMITPAHDVKVLDFGLSAPAGDDPAQSSGGIVVDDRAEAPSSAQLADSAWAAGPMSVAGLTAFRSQDGAVIGTAAYMSPEQGRGEPATPASDIYSYGLVIEEVFAGRLRHEAAHVRPDGADGPRVEHRIPTDIESLIAKLKAHAPSQRPTAEAVVERLKWIADAPRRRRRHLAVAALVVLALGGLAKYTWDLSRERAAAVAARDEAERRRDQAEDLIGFMVGDLRSRLTAVGRLDLLDEVGQKALGYFQSVPADTLTGEEVFRRSQTMHQLGQVRQARADLPGALAAYEESLALAERVAREDSGNAAWQLGLGTSHFYVGEIKRRRGDLDGALTHFRTYQAIAKNLTERDPNNVAWKLELSYGYSNVAAILSGRGDLEGAREQLVLTRTLQTAIAAVKPGDTTIQLSRANNLNRLGVVLQRLGRFQEAADSFAAEIEIYRALSAADPRNTQFLRRLPGALRLHGQLLRALGDSRAALTQFRSSLDLSRQLTVHDSSNVDWRIDLISGELFMGRALIDEDQLAAALQLYRSATAKLAPLVDANRGRLDLARSLAAGRAGMGEILLAQGQPAAAVSEADAAAALVEPMLATDPADAVAARLLAAACNLRARIHDGRGNAAAARAEWTRTVDSIAPFADETTDYYVLDPHVRALLGLGRHDEARRHFDRLSALGYREREFMKFWSQTAAGAR
jgi:tRNA A-37 threonylcarbamoyl transferase component Bud32/tetratricopeptide (TPR) repeat protein